MKQIVQAILSLLAAGFALTVCIDRLVLLVAGGDVERDDHPFCLSFSPRIKNSLLGRYLIFMSLTR